jgi:hypothetical protein
MGYGTGHLTGLWRLWILLRISLAKSEKPLKSVLTSAAALPYTMRTGGQRWNFGEMGSGWAGNSSAVGFFRLAL